jgi:hypothetical protein
MRKSLLTGIALAAMTVAGATAAEANSVYFGVGDGPYDGGYYHHHRYWHARYDDDYWRHHYWRHHDWYRDRWDRDHEWRYRHDW